MIGKETYNYQEFEPSPEQGAHTEVLDALIDTDGNHVGTRLINDIKNGNLKNVVFAGVAGIGKSTLISQLAIRIENELGQTPDYHFWSDEMIDTYHKNVQLEKLTQEFKSGREITEHEISFSHFSTWGEEEYTKFNIYYGLKLKKILDNKSRTQDSTPLLIETVTVGEKDRATSATRQAFSNHTDSTHFIYVNPDQRIAEKTINVRNFVTNHWDGSVGLASELLHRYKINIIDCDDSQKDSELIKYVFNRMSPTVSQRQTEHRGQGMKWKRGLLLFQEDLQDEKLHELLFSREYRTPPLRMRLDMGAPAWEVKPTVHSQSGSERIDLSIINHVSNLNGRKIRETRKNILPPQLDILNLQERDNAKIHASFLKAWARNMGIPENHTTVATNPRLEEVIHMSVKNRLSQYE